MRGKDRLAPNRVSGHVEERLGCLCAHCAVCVFEKPAKRGDNPCRRPLATDGDVDVRPLTDGDGGCDVLGVAEEVAE